MTSTPAAPDFVMNPLRLNTTRKASIKIKRIQPATTDDYRAELFGLWHEREITLYLLHAS